MAARLLNTNAAARMLNCSTEWIRRLSDRGDLPAEKLASGQRVFRVEDVEKLARERAAMKASAATVGDKSEMEMTS